MSRLPTPASNVVRLAVLQGDVVQDELHQHAPGHVFVGTGYENDVLLSGATAPVRHRLFELYRGEYVLNLPPGARGKIRLGHGTFTVAALRQRFGHGDTCRVKLDARAKGKLRLGDSTIVFQRSRPKPLPRKLPFPRIFRASVLAMLGGGLFLVSQGISAGTLGPFFLWAWLAPIPPDLELDIEERFLIAIGSPRLLDREERPEKPPEEETLAQKDETKVDPVTERKLETKPEQFSEKAVQAARSVGVARVLGTYGGPGAGTVFDVIASTENNLGELFAQGMTTTVLSDGGAIGAFVPGGDGISLRGDAVNTLGFETGDGPALEHAPDKAERKVEAKVRATTSTISGDGDPTALKQTIQHRIGGLKSCYTSVLRVQPNLGTGKHTYTIDINEMGRVTRVAIEEDTLGSAKVADCARIRIQGWRFPMQGAQDGSEVTFSVVYSGQ